MIGKIISCSSFAGTVGYVMKKDQSRILAAEGIAPPDVRDMVRDLKDQTLLNPRLKNAVGHISLSFSPKDADKLTDAKMTGIAREYMERMGIRDTQFLLVRHLDQAHPHCHLVYNRVGNNGQTISDKNIKIRNGKVCKELTAKHGLYYAKGKEQVNRDPDCGNRTKPNTRFTNAIRHVCLVANRGAIWKPGCRSQGDYDQLQILRPDRPQAGVLFGKTALRFQVRKSIGRLVIPA